MIHRHGAGPRRPDPNRCGRGHDLTDPKNRIDQPDGTVKCRECKRITNRRLYELLPIRTTCCGCGGPKKPNKARLCDPCRWRRAVREVRRHREDSIEAVERTLDAAVALECEPWWIRRPPVVP